MIAIPLDTKDATVISELYGNAPYFGLLDEENGSFTSIKNDACGNGVKTAEFLKTKGADATIFFHMGEGLYKAYSKNGVDVFTCKREKQSVDSIYLKFLEKGFQQLNNNNYKLYLDSGTASCTCNGKNCS